MADDVYELRGARVRKLWPVWLIYAALLVLSALGYALDAFSDSAYLIWFTFYLAAFTGVCCIPFGLGVGILAQARVWYTPRYAHRFILLNAILVMVCMLVGWWPHLMDDFDPVYLLVCIWPSLISSIFMQIGMHLVRKNEYRQAEADNIYDESPKRRR